MKGRSGDTGAELITHKAEKAVRRVCGYIEALGE
jgi:hypothetical protein